MVCSRQFLEEKTLVGVMLLGFIIKRGISAGVITVTSD
jgi:hypothetical protein